MHRFLFRGVNPHLHAQNQGVLVPKAFTPFRYSFHFGEDVFFGGGATYGEFEVNAVLRHEVKQAGFPTSGISTTPFVDRARLYATHGKTYSAGFVYKIDSGLLELYRVKAYVVADYAARPSVPEDEEVILVAHDFGPLPQEVIVEVLEV